MQKSENRRKQKAELAVSEKRGEQRKQKRRLGRGQAGVIMVVK